MRKIIIAIDGLSACGKSTTAREVARILGYRHIDSGAMYRAMTLYFLEHHTVLTNPTEIAKTLSHINITFKIDPNGTTKTYLNGVNVESEIRKKKISEWVSPVSAIKAVREKLVEIQRKMGKNKGIVMDGRDIGTVVFPHADLKIFMTANIQVRSLRRQQELHQQNDLISLDEVMTGLKKRDKYDSTRKESPLIKSPDMILLDTTYTAFDEQIDEVIRLATVSIIVD